MKRRPPPTSLETTGAKPVRAGVPPADVGDANSVPAPSEEDFAEAAAFSILRVRRLLHDERALWGARSRIAESLSAARAKPETADLTGLTALIDSALPREDHLLGQIAEATRIPVASLYELRRGRLLAEGAWPDGIVRLAILLGVDRDQLLRFAEQDLRAEEGRAGAPPDRFDRVAARLELLAACWEDVEAQEDVPGHPPQLPDRLGPDPREQA